MRKKRWKYAFMPRPQKKPLLTEKHRTARLQLFCLQIPITNNRRMRGLSVLQMNVLSTFFSYWIQRMMWFGEGLKKAKSHRHIKWSKAQGQTLTAHYYITKILNKEVKPLLSRRSTAILGDPGAGSGADSGTFPCPTICPWVSEDDLLQKNPRKESTEICNPSAYIQYW